MPYKFNHSSSNSPVPSRMFIPQEFIRKKRDGAILSPDAIAEFIAGITGNAVSDAQIAAFCMAALLNGLSPDETASLTTAMAQSGTVLQWGDLQGRIVDKHSTGGVGDKISLMLAPMVAACGLYVPMIAGRGLGHTGGTVDKLDCIPGYQTRLSLEIFQKTVREVGCAIIGQTGALAPADGRIYAVRDVTGTVESIPLITASILSKKLSAGLDALVMDVKYGNGAFMPDEQQARALAASLRRVGMAAGLKINALLTDMNQVLGHSAGNSVEVIEAVEYLTGQYREPRLHQITLALASEMLVLGGAADDAVQATRMAQNALDTGKAAAIFGQMLAAQGASPNLLDNPRLLLGEAPVIIDLMADRDGIVTGMATRDIGMLLVALKAGRARVEDPIDPVIGLTHIAPVGTICETGKTRLAQLHLRHKESAAFAAAAFLRCIAIGHEMPEASLIIPSTHLSS